jgi:2,3-bisphosphoglycerate-dependent phosphoglycerate mutase
VVVVVELVVVRHGQSTWNVEHRFTGQADPPLSEHGLRQAHALATACRNQPFEAVVTSDLRRAHRTGQVVAEALGLPPPTVMPALRERWSEWMTGRTRDEIESAYPGTLAAWRRGRAVGAPGPHEEFVPFTGRVLGGLAAAARHGRRVVVAAHAGAFVALDAVFGAGGTEVANAEGRLVKVEDGRVVGVTGLVELPPVAPVERTGQRDP